MGLPIVASLIDASRNQPRFLEYLLEQTQKYGLVWALDIGLKKRFWVTIDPECCDFVLKRRFSEFERGKERYIILEELLGNGIFNANGKVWKLHRNVAKPLFRSESIDKAMVPVFASHVGDLFRILDDHAETGKPIEITQLFMQYTMTTFLSLGLGCDDLSAEEKTQFAAWFDYVQTESAHRTFRPWWQWTISSNFKNAVRRMDGFVYDIIRKRRREPVEALRAKSDIFSQFLVLTDDNGKPFTDEYLRNVFINFLLAGRDTTAAMLTWTCYVLAKEDRVRDRVIEEIERNVSGDVPTAEEIHRLDYLKRTFTEVLRLYPSVPLNSREATSDLTLPCGVRVKKGDIMWYCPWVQGRLLYDDPMKFDPDRWLPERAKSVPNGLFTAFHLGPQTCLGKEMAYVEARAALAAVLKKYSLSLVSDAEKVEYKMPSIILLPKNGMTMRVTKRG